MRDESFSSSSSSSSFFDLVFRENITLENSKLGRRVSVSISFVVFRNECCENVFLRSVEFWKGIGKCISFQKRVHIIFLFVSFFREIQTNGYIVGGIFL